MTAKLPFLVLAAATSIFADPPPQVTIIQSVTAPAETFVYDQRPAGGQDLQAIAGNVVLEARVRVERSRRRQAGAHGDRGQIDWP